MVKKAWVFFFSAFIGLALTFSVAQAEKEKKPASKPSVGECSRLMMTIRSQAPPSAAAMGTDRPTHS